MTDRHSGYLVVLDHDLREDDAQPILDAIAMIKGVAQVRPVIADTIGAIAESRAKRELTVKLLEALK